MPAAPSDYHPIIFSQPAACLLAPNPVGLWPPAASVAALESLALTKTGAVPGLTSAQMTTLQSCQPIMEVLPVPPHQEEVRGAVEVLEYMLPWVCMTVCFAFVSGSSMVTDTISPALLCSYCVSGS